MVWRLFATKLERAETPEADRPTQWRAFSLLGGAAPFSNCGFLACRAGCGCVPSRRRTHVEQAKTNAQTACWKMTVKDPGSRQPQHGLNFDQAE